MGKSLVIMHFYNESMLLPYWINHHVRMFDEGVLIDYNSTDDSYEICKKLAPKWKIIKSQNEMFDAKKCDEEVMDIEEEYDGYWKIALNTTEFVLSENFNEYVDAVTHHHPDAMGFRAHGIHMVDPLEIRNVPLHKKQPLILQRHWGIDLPSHGRDRLIHKAKNGNYDTGRHNTFLKDSLAYGNDVYVLWYGWSPWPQVLERKLQIKNKIPESDKELGLGKEHFFSEEDLEKEWKRLSSHTENLLDDKSFANVWQKTMKTVHGWPIMG